jgi:glycine betaine catabolism B
MQLRRVIHLALRVAIVSGMCASAAIGEALAQTAEEHASHHPDQTTAPPPGGTPPAKAPGMMDGMGEMMKGMGASPPKELYPTLMALPELSPEHRKHIEEQADERMRSGSALMAKAMDTLNAATASGDYVAMQDAAARLREGIGQMESGIAAHRALAEGKAPREVALTWFKREMNLSLGATPAAHGLFGVTPFHLFTMILLVAFALAMLAMYFFKMRRAAALFGRIESDNGPPPPGSAPELSGGKPPGDKPPSAGVSPSDRKAPPSTPTSPAPPEAGTRSPSESSPDASSAVHVSNGTSAPPVTANWRGRLRVGSIVEETPSVKTFRLLPSPNENFLPFTFVPGQFLNLAFWIGGARMNRSYSISSSPRQRDYVDLTVRREPRGAVSRHILDLLQVGDEIEAGGPVGRFTFNGTEAESIVLVSGGVGITPMMSITRYLTEQSWPGEIFFIYTCRTPADLIFADEIAALQRRNPKLRVAVTMTRAEGTDWKGPRGHLTKDLLTQTVPNLTSRRIHLCGPPSMMDSAKGLLRELGVPPDQVKTESFGTPKPLPAAPGTIPKPVAPATGPLVTFSKNNKASRIHVDQTILELSEELGIGIEFSCRVGTCGVCKVKMTSGEVDMAVEDSLDAEDKANGIILACQAKPKSAVAVEA